MPAPVVATALKLAVPFVLPYIMGAVGRKVLPYAAKKVMKTGSGTNPVTGMTEIFKVPTMASTALEDIGGALGDIGHVAAAPIPHIIDFAGRGIEAAGKTAGAGLKAAGQIPAAFANQSNAKRELYGMDPMTMLAGITAPLGEAAGVGAEALTGALGGTLTGIGNALRQYQVLEGIKRDVTKAKHITPSQASYTESLRKAISNETRGRPL